MSKRIRASWWVGVAALLLLSPLASSQTYLTLQDGGNNGVVGGIYVGPYDATLSTGPGAPGTNVQIICDDFEHEVSPGQSWYANVTSVSSITNSTTGLVWSGHTAGGSALGVGSFGLQQGYDAMAFLATQLMGTTDKTMAGYLAYAIWAVFDAGAVHTWLNNHGAGSIWATVQSLAVGALNGTYSAGQFTGWEILTPIGGGNSPPQEFFMYVPEGGTALMYLLLAGFACFGTMFFKSRRRSAASEIV